MSNIKTDNKNSSSRRKILKSIAIGGGAVVTAKSLPQQWTKPVLDQVMLPAHAEMSGVAAGTYVTGSPLSLNFNQKKPDFAEEQYALLDALISPAHAGHAGARNFCGTDNDAIDDDDAGGNSDLYIRINENLTVDIVIDAVSNNSSVKACGGSSTISGIDIADTDVQISSDDDFYVRLTNMVVAANQVTGNYQTVGSQDGGSIGPMLDNDNLECSGTFTAPLGGSFPMSVTCDDNPD